MSYSTGEALVLTRLQAVSGFTTTNTSRGKWGILNSGKAAVYGIIKPGPAEREFVSSTLVINHWRAMIQIWRRYKDDGDTLTNLETDVALVLAEFDRYGKLADTTGTIPNDARASRVGEAQEMWLTSEGGPSWLKQEVTIEWEEQATINPAE